MMSERERREAENDEAVLQAVLRAVRELHASGSAHDRDCAHHLLECWEQARAR